MIVPESESTTTAQLVPVSTLLGAPTGDLEDLDAGIVALAGLYCDHFCNTEPGARLAARQVRYGCSLYARADRRAQPLAANVVDIGDLNVFPLEPAKNLSVLMDQTSRIAATGAKLLAIGGDYSLTPALIGGLKGTGQSPGYVIRVSRQLDLADMTLSGGAPNRNSSSRVISEGIDGGLSSIMFLGCAGRSGLEEAELARSTTCVSGYSMEADTEHVFNTIREMALAQAGPIYLSLDADVLDRRHLNTAPRRRAGQVSLTHLIELLRALHGAKFIGAHLSGFIPGLATTQWDATRCVVVIAEEMANLMQGETA